MTAHHRCLVTLALATALAGPTSAQVSIAVIGDYGTGSVQQQQVADLIAERNPMYVATTGDNVYSSSGYATPYAALQGRIGDYYDAWIDNNVEANNRFFPTIGDHDWGKSAADIGVIACPGGDCSGSAWLDFFALPNNERYYEKRLGPVHLFVLSDYGGAGHDPDFQPNRQSVQYKWLEQEMAASDAPWKLVFLHLPPYASIKNLNNGVDGGYINRRFIDFPGLRADAVFVGNNHFYERLEVDGILHFVNASGGASLHAIRPADIIPQSQFRYSTTEGGKHGAMFLDATATEINYRFVNIDGQTVDSVTRTKPGPASDRFAVIGDYGNGSPAEQAVADLVRDNDAGYVMTTGDNVYGSLQYGTGEAAIDALVYNYFGDWIDRTSATNTRFFPTLGDHDWGKVPSDISVISCPGGVCSGAWLDYFTLPGNERYYRVRRGSVEFFIMSDFGGTDHDPDWDPGSFSPQHAWLQQSLDSSTAPWKVVLLHFPPWSSIKDPDNPQIDGGYITRRTLLFKEWGAHAVIAGNNHWYERLEHEGVDYFVNGAGGATKYAIDPANVIPQSKFRYSATEGGEHGAMFIDASDSEITYQFKNIDGELVDTITRTKGAGAPTQVEVGARTLSQSNADTWTRVDLSRTFVNPAVVMGVPGFRGSDPVLVRVRNVTPTSFEFQLDEWDYQDGTHGTETIGYLVMESGSHTIDGREWHAGVMGAVDHNLQSQSIPSSAFGGQALLLTQVVTANGPDSVVPRVTGFDGTTFQVKLQEQESLTDGHAAEEVAYVVGWSGSGALGGLEAHGFVKPAVDHTFESGAITFPDPVINPLVFAQITSENESDPASLRFTDLSAVSARLRIEEEQSLDSETSHAAEEVRWLVIEQPGQPVAILAGLQGPHNGSEMTAGLSDVIPSRQPYASEPVPYFGSEDVGSLIEDLTNVVDWVVVELRNTISGPAVASRAGLLLSSGRVADIDGIRDVSFPGISPGAYYIVVRHRNSLAVISPVKISIGGNGLYYGGIRSGSTPVERD